jgi:hypothetical protein
MFIAVIESSATRHTMLNDKANRSDTDMNRVYLRTPSPNRFERIAVRISSGRGGLNFTVISRLFLSALTVTLLSLFVTNAKAANWYVRPGGAGSGTGADWNNACDSTTIMSKAVSPGDTIWLAGGDYAHGITFSRNGTSGSPITVMRATGQDSAATSAAGWNATTMDKLARFFGSFNMQNAQNITIDGNSKATDTYGIKIDRNPAHGTWTGASSPGQGVGCWGGFSTVNLKYYRIEVEGRHASAGLDGTTFDGFGISGTGTVISHCSSHDDDTLIRCNGGQNVLIEYCSLANAMSGTASDHPDSIFTDGCNGFVLRYCRITDAVAESVFFGGSTDCNNVWIYGNLIYKSSGFYIAGWGSPAGQLITFRDTSPITGVVHIFNNTFYYPDGATAVYQGMTPGLSSSGECYNNAIYSSVALCSCAPIQYGNNVTFTASDVVNAAAGDFRPTASSRLLNAGRALTVDGYINTDMDGNTRGANGGWDVGAYEYGTASTNPVISLSASSLGFGVVASGVRVTNSLTVQNVGQGTLAGSATVALPFQIVSGGTYSLGPGVSQTIKVSYTPSGNPADSQIITFTGGGGAQAIATGSRLVVLSGLSFPSYAGVITAPFSTNGGYVLQSADSGVTDGGRAVYGFNISTQGNYTVSASINAPSEAANSFYLNIDAEPTDPTTTWDIPMTSGFEIRTASWRGNGTATSSQFVPAVFTLAAGTHQLIIVGREGSTQLGQITIAPYDASRPIQPAPPQNLRVVSSQ